MLRDPLSHYLFILCVKTLYVKSSQATQARAINGINVCSCAPQISNLLFVDDSIIFARSTLEEANPITSILKAYEEASSQRINFQKIKLSCSQNMPWNTNNCMLSKKQIFQFVEERMWKKFKGWKEKALSKVGREILIKSVVQAIPIIGFKIEKYANR